MTTYLNLAVAGSLVLFSTSASAELTCDVQTTETLTIDMQGIQLAKIEMESDSLTIEGGDSDEATIEVRKCASTEERLGKMDFIARRQGETMIFEMDAGGSSAYSRGWFGSRGGNYGRFEINATLPAHLAAEVKISSGRATIGDIANLNAQVSSGQLVIRDIENKVSTRVSSGSADIHNVGSLYVSSIGSGQIRSQYVNGDTRVNTIGSGQFRASHTEGNVSIGSIGSGSVQIEHLSGSAEVDRVGSGSARIDDVNGDVYVGSVGSGSVSANRIGGDVSLDKKGSGSLRTSEVQGQVRQPGDNRQK